MYGNGKSSINSFESSDVMFRIAYSAVKVVALFSILIILVRNQRCAITNDFDIQLVILPILSFE